MVAVRGGRGRTEECVCASVECWEGDEGGRRGDSKRARTFWEESEGGGKATARERRMGGGECLRWVPGSGTGQF